jgi:signal transduction histidine kinase
MKKLKVKIYATIFSILTIFISLIFITNTSKNYYEKKKNIDGNLRNISLSGNSKGKEENKEKNSYEPIDTYQSNRRIYLNFNIYTIVLDDDGNYQEIINNTAEDSIDEKKIKKIAISIIKNHNTDYFIGNLYKDKYAYTFTPQNTLIIMDNSNLNSELKNSLIFAIIWFILLEVILGILTHFITCWIVIPVQEAFIKQKRFIADASHELKTPLSVMIASADAYFNDKNDKWVHNMKNEADRMIKLTTELLDLSSIEEQNLKMEKENLSDIIEGSILTFESLFYENHIKLKYNILQNIYMDLNEMQIKELISILIDNAIRHCKKNGEVNINLYREDKLIVFEVKNTGDQINKEDLEKIFERFYKTDTSRNRNANNYGLGLSIAKSIVEKHKGKIAASSRDGITTFKVVWKI